MKLAIILIVLTFSALIPLAIISGSYGLLIGFSLSVLVVLALYFTDRSKEKQLLAKVSEVAGGKVWDIPVERNCQHCQTLLKFDFDLETTEIKCASCEQVNKLTMDIRLFPKN